MQFAQNHLSDTFDAGQIRRWKDHVTRFRRAFCTTSIACCLSQNSIHFNRVITQSLYFGSSIRHVELYQRCVLSTRREESSLLPVNIKHAGKTHSVEVDTRGPAAKFKESIYQVTGVPTGPSQRA